MSLENGLVRLSARNFRSLASVTLETGSLTVLFGPNGAGKSTFLDTIWFVRDCAIRGVERASSERSHGIGALWDRADEDDNIAIEIETAKAKYEVRFGYSSGRIEPFVGESLFSKTRQLTLVQRAVGSDKAEFYHSNLQQSFRAELRDAEKLALTNYLVFDTDSEEAASIDQLLRYLHFYHAREADFYGLRKRGSESSYHSHVWDRYQNLFSALRNIHDRRGVDDRFDTIIRFMRECFPPFKDLLLEQTGPESVYCSFIEAGRVHPIKASGVSDGHLQMLAHLTCLFGEGRDRESFILLDEPEISLHPHALATLAKAIRLATRDWQKQVFVATHSPVLISQFEPSEIVAVEIGADGRTILRRVSDIPEIEDLLHEYAAGSLYMAEMIAAQGSLRLESNGVPTQEWQQRGFRWPSPTKLALPDGGEVVVEPAQHLSSREREDLTQRQRKFLRIYRVVFSANDAREMHELEVEGLLGEAPNSQ